METAIGRVSSLAAGTATVVVAAQLVCGRCAAGNGCGAGLVFSNDATRQFDVAIPAGMALSRGDRVNLRLAPNNLLRAAMIVYGLPLVLMVLAVVFASGFDFFGSDAATVLFAMGGLAAGFIIGRRLLARAGACDRFVPVIDGRTDARCD